MEIDSLEEVRVNIDRIDREIVRLMGERGRFVKEAARFKSSMADVEAPARVQIVIEKVRSLAIAHALSPDVAEAAYRAMISAFIKVEADEFERETHDRPLA